MRWNVISAKYTGSTGGCPNFKVIAHHWYVLHWDSPYFETRRAHVSSPKTFIQTLRVHEPLLGWLFGTFEGHSCEQQYLERLRNDCEDFFLVSEEKFLRFSEKDSEKEEMKSWLVTKQKVSGKFIHFMTQYYVDF